MKWGGAWENKQTLNYDSDMRINASYNNTYNYN